MENKLNYTKLKDIILTSLKSCTHEHEAHDALDEFITYYYSTFNKYLQNNGKEYTLALFKLIHDQAIAIALHRSIKPIPFHKCGKDGVSRHLRLAKPLLLSNDAKLIRLVLTCTRVYEAIRLEPTFDEAPIVSPYSGEIDLAKFIDDFRLFLRESKWFGRLKKLFSENFKPSTRLRGRIRSGPNGQANITSHYDAVAVTKDSSLYNSIKRLNEILGQTFITESLDFCASQSKDIALGKVHTGKIVLIPERAGKTRLVAVGDFWSQNTLQSIHDILMLLLRSLDTDCTYDQNEGFFRIQRSGLKHKYISSNDLTKATDRFPVVIIEAMFKELCQNQELVHLWKSILVDRRFNYEDVDYQWEVGNPLGLLSSWAAFSLTHHCIIQYSSYKQMSSMKRFKRYAILGDDVAIWHGTISNYYAKLMNGLGVTINKSKSLVSRPGHYQFEFAKRISTNGNEVTGIPYDILVNSTKSIYNYVDLIIYQVDTKFISKPLRLDFPQYLTPKGVRYLEILLWEQELIVPDILGNTDHVRILTLLRNACLHERLLRMKEISEDLSKALGDKTLQDYCTKWGIGYSDNLFNYTGTNHVHPIVESLNYTGMKLWDTIGILEELNSSVDLVTQDIYPDLDECEYLPLPYMPAYFERPGKRDATKRRTHSEIVLKSIHTIRADLPVIVLDKDPLQGI